MLMRISEVHYRDFTAESKGTAVLDHRRCEVNTAAELDAEIRDIFALDQVGRADEISGTLYVHYSDESVKQTSLVPALQRRGVEIIWQKKPPTS